MRQYFFAILALCLMLSPVIASEVVVMAETEQVTLTPVPTLIPYINQGDTVYVGDYVDISGVAPPYLFLAYWDGFDMYDSPPRYNLTLPDGKKGYYKFYIDPEIFGGRTGRWYKWDGKYERQGNNRMFTVMPAKTFNSTMTFPNGTTVNLSENIQQNYTSHVIVPEPMLPERHLADYVAARGQSVVWPDGGYRLWVFGNKQGIYGVSTNVISKEDVQVLEPGRYTVAVHIPGNNTIFEANYVNDTLVPGLFGKSAVSVRGMAAPVVFQKFKEMLAGTDDKIFEYSMVLEEPYITINRADEIWHNGRTVLDIRGYTNVANGTSITVTLDENNFVDYKASTTAVRTSPGNLSYYRAYVPLDYENLAANAMNHTLIARTEIGGSVQKDFKISVMPADSFRPNATLKYIEDRNPFVPTPTPEVITVIKTQVVIQTITIPVTPTNETVYAQQRKAQEDVTYNWLSLAAIALVALVVLIGGGLYAMRVWRRL
jgi:hypothetical protein